MLGYLTLLIFIPLAFALVCGVVRESWVRGAAIMGAAWVFMLGLWCFQLYPGEKAPALGETWSAPGGILEAALDREGVYDLVVRERFRELLARQGGISQETSEQLGAIGRELAMVDLAQADLAWRKRLPEPELEQLRHAEAVLRAAQLEAARLTASLQGLERELGAVRLAASGAQQSQFKLVQHAPWVPALGLFYFVGADGLSLALALLVSLLTLLALAFAGFSETGTTGKALRRSCVLLLLLESGLIGVFCALDLMLFFVFWVLVLIPGYFLVGGGGRSSPGAEVGARFFLPAFVGSLALLVGFLALSRQAFGGLLPEGTFNLLAILEQVRLSAPGTKFQGLLFVALFLGCAVRLPLFPLHGWLPAAQAHVTPSFAAMIQGGVLVSGGYGLMRLAWPLCPDIVTDPTVVNALGVVAVLSIVFGALSAMAQHDLRRLVAYASVSHAGYVLLGLCSLTPGALAGSALELIAHGAAGAGASLAVGVLASRTKERDLLALGGLVRPMPRLAALSALLLLSMAAFPGLAGFPARLLGGVTLAALAGLILGSAGLLWALNRVFLGELYRQELRNVADVSPWDAVALIPIAAACLALGIVPRLVLDVITPALEAYLTALSLPS